MTKPERHSLQHLCDDLLGQQQSLLIASLSASGTADISYAPYLYDSGGFYILVSELAAHTQNLLARPQASILLIEPEASATNPFARKRLRLDCTVREILKNAADYQNALQGMADKFGDIIGVLSALTDFHMLCLQPVRGQFVAGFGKAFAVDAQLNLQNAALLGAATGEDREIEE